ncbi:MAG TPA: flippase-like domain-containing protein [bacterium]|nr:flippase-like domain-containing protein [bacterium]
MSLGVKESHLRNGFVIFILVSVALMVGILFWTTDRDTWLQMRNFRLGFVPLLIILSVIRWYMDGMFFVILAKHGHKSSISLNRSTIIRLEGTVLSAVIPILVGTFAMHAYLLHKERFKVSESVAMTVLRAILPIFLFLFNIPILFLFRNESGSSKFFTQLIEVVSPPIAISVVFFIIALFCPNHMKRGATVLVRWFGKIKRFKHGEEKLLALEQRVFREIDHFSNIFWMYLKERKGVLIHATFWIFLAFFVDYLVAVAIIWGFGYYPLFWRAIAVQMLIRPIIYLAPTPGGVGIWELSYLGFFSLYMPHSLIGISVLIWRLLLSYIPIIIGGFYTVHEFGRDENFRKMMEDHVTHSQEKTDIEDVELP